jgi:hypothetical protein
MSTIYNFDDLNAMVEQLSHQAATILELFGKTHCKDYYTVADIESFFEKSSCNTRSKHPVTQLRFLLTNKFTRSSFVCLGIDYRPEFSQGYKFNFSGIAIETDFVALRTAYKNALKNKLASAKIRQFNAKFQPPRPAGEAHLSSVEHLSSEEDIEQPAIPSVQFTVEMIAKIVKDNLCEEQLQELIAISRQ